MISIRDTIVLIANDENHTKCREDFPELYKVIDGIGASNSDNLSAKHKHELYTEFNKSDVKNGIRKTHVVLYYIILEALDGYTEEPSGYFD